MSEDGADTETRTAVVVIDNNAVTLASCRQILEREGYAVATFDNGPDGLVAVPHVDADAVVVDLNMPAMSGLEVIDRLRARDPHVAILAITGYPTVESAVMTMKRGADDYLAKPFTPGELRRALARVLEQRRATVMSSNALRAAKEPT